MNTTACSLCNAIESRGDKHQPWCPKRTDGDPTQPDTFEFQQSINKYAEVFIEKESPAMRPGVFIHYFNGAPKAVHVGRVPADAPRGEYQRLPNYVPSWVAAHVVDRVMREGEKKYPDHPYLQISVEEHMEHILDHIELLKIGDASEPHLEHVMCRAAMIFDILERELVT